MEGVLYPIIIVNMVSLMIGLDKYIETNFTLTRKMTVKKK